MKLRIGTRGSRLALWQAERVAALLQASGADPELVIVRTTGDRRTDVPLSAIGGKGMFVKELEDALAEGRIDLAVHSLKDVPSVVPHGMLLAAFPEREDPRDAWLQPEGKTPGELPAGARVATGSPRRAARLRQMWPHLEVAGVRGNVDTRLRSLREGDSSAMILAMAGLKRLELETDTRAPLDPDVMVPAAGQGILAVETMQDRTDVIDTVRRINDVRVEREARAERAVLERFGAQLDCHSAIGVHAFHTGSDLEIVGYVGNVLTGEGATVRSAAPVAEVTALAQRVFDGLIEQNALAILGIGGIE